jgi:type I restriction enzyme, S subunit
VRYRPYPSYRTDTERILPSFWQDCLLKRILTVQSGDMISADTLTSEGYPVVGGNGIRGYASNYNTPADTIVIGRVGAKCGCVHVLREPFWASEHAFRVIPRATYSLEFIARLLDSLNLNQFAITTAQPLLNSELATRHPVAIPPLEEQTQIAKFLDYETAKIDALIEKQRHLIVLLQEKRQAVISHAVTKGLNPDTPMRDSGVEWLGKVPAHWEVGRYKDLFRIEQGVGFKSSEYVAESNVVSVRMGNIKKGGNLDLSHKVVYLPSSYASQFNRYALSDGDLIVAMTDMSPSLEFLAVPACMTGLESDKVYLLNQRVGKLLLSQRCDSEYIRFALLSDALRAYLRAIGLGTVQANMSNADLYGAHVAIPPLEEQREIASRLSTKIAKIDGLTETQQYAIEIMNERRTALISAAVTGKIDVRGWKPPVSEADAEVA